MNRLKAIVFVILMSLSGSIYCQSMDCFGFPAFVELDIKQIPLYNERVFFMYKLLNDERFEVSIGSDDGVFIVKASRFLNNEELNEAFENFRRQKSNEYSLMDKQQASLVAIGLKDRLPKQFTLSLMMDIYESLRQNNLCETADPFCTDNGLYEFPAGVNAGSGEIGPYYDCLGTTPNPAWYYMKIDHSGSIDIHMYSTPSVDIDYCCWGPFNDPTDPCPYGLTSSKVVSCSFSPDPTETCAIPSSANSGDYYILLITNYSNEQCNIHFSKTSGSGTTDCSILPPLIDNDGPFCDGETIHLMANGPSIATYSWSGPNGFYSQVQNPIIYNATPSMSGSYTCTITVGTATNYATTEVEVYSLPVADVCEDQTVNYGGLVTLRAIGDPDNYIYRWEPSDKVLSPNSSTTQTVNMDNTQRFTLTVTNQQGYCSKSNFTTVFVDGTAMSADLDVSADDICAYDTIQFQVQTFDGTGEYTYSWTPSEYLSDPCIPNPLAYPKHSTTFVCHISDGMTTIDLSIPVTVHTTLDPTILGFTQVAVTSSSLPGIYNYYIADSIGVESCNVTWTSSNPNWIVLPTSSDYQCSLVVLSAGESTITVTANCESGCDTTYSIQVHAFPYALDEYEDDPVIIYPNPASNYVTVKLDGMNRVKLYNNHGVVIKDIMLEEIPQIEIDISELEQGIYIAEVVSNNKKYYRKLSKY